MLGNIKISPLAKSIIKSLKSVILFSVVLPGCYISRSRILLLNFHETISKIS